MKKGSINKGNFFKTVSEIGYDNLPLILKQCHTFMRLRTDNGNNWSEYEADKQFKTTADLIFKKMEEFMESGKTKGTLKGVDDDYSGINREIYFINRFLKFHDIVVHKVALKSFLEDLQFAIERKQITKKSPVAKEIMDIQKSVIKVYNKMKTYKHCYIKPNTIKRLKAIIEKYENDSVINESGKHTFYPRASTKQLEGLKKGIRQNKNINIKQVTENLRNLKF